jgi:hypothetical protein
MIRPLQEARFCSNSRQKEFLTPQLPFDNKVVKKSDNENTGQRILSISLFKQF